MLALYLRIYIVKNKEKKERTKLRLALVIYMGIKLYGPDNPFTLHYFSKELWTKQVKLLYNNF